MQAFLLKPYALFVFITLAIVSEPSFYPHVRIYDWSQVKSIIIAHKQSSTL